MLSVNPPTQSSGTPLILLLHGYHLIQSVWPCRRAATRTSHVWCCLRPRPFALHSLSFRRWLVLVTCTCSVDMVDQLKFTPKSREQDARTYSASGGSHDPKAAMFCLKIPAG